MKPKPKQAAKLLPEKTAVETWQPIETAPKDGTEVLLFYPNYNRKIWIGSYEKREHLSHGKVTYGFEGWDCSGMMDLASLRDSKCEPTYWMPLPEPPL